MNDNRSRFHVRREIHTYGYGLYVAQHCNDGSVLVSSPLSFKRIERGAMVSAPTIFLAPEEAQELIDELWASGVRPTEANGSAGQAQATAKHLEDMRTIAFSQLKITRP